MAKYTGIHRFSIPHKYSWNFLVNYSNVFDITGKFRNMYNTARIDQDIEGNKTMLIYIETVDDKDLQEEIEKLKKLLDSPHWYTMLQTKRLYQLLGSQQQICKLLNFNMELKEDTEYKYKYLYYIAKSKPIKIGAELNFEYLYFLAESDKYVVPEQIIEEQFNDYEGANCCVCIKAALSEDSHERIMSSDICSIYFPSYYI